MYSKWTVFSLSVAIGAGGILVAGPGGLSAAEVEGPKLEWKVSVWGKRRAFTEGIEKLSEIVAEKTDGNWNIKLYYGATLSKARENLDGIKLGAFEMAFFCNFYHPGKNPAWMVYTMPFLPLGDAEVSRTVRMQLPEHPALKADLDRWNAMFYVSTLLPQYEFLGKGEPPEELEDWKGMRVRAGGGIGQAMEKLGAIPTSMPATEVYTSIERGTIDAVSFPFTYAHAAYKIHEVSDWFTANMSPGTSECPVVINKDAYAALPEQYKQLLEDARGPVLDRQIEVYLEADEKNLPMFEAELEKIVYTEAQIEQFREVAGKPVWDEWVAANADKFDGQELIDRIFQIAAEVKGR